MLVSSPYFVFGVADDGIMSGPGGVFFGLIKNTEKRILPNFLGQTDVTSFIIDLRESGISGERMSASTSIYQYHSYFTLDCKCQCNG
jgi:hypothetical protein